MTPTEEIKRKYGSDGVRIISELLQSYWDDNGEFTEGQSELLLVLAIDFGTVLNG